MMTEEGDHSGAWQRAVLDHVRAAIFLKDLDGRYLMINRWFAELLGVTEEGVVGKTDYDFLPTTFADAFRASDRRALDAGTAVEVEEVAPCRGDLQTAIVIKVPLLGPDSKPYAVCGIATDITARKNAELALQERESVLRSFYDGVPLGLAVAELAGGDVRIVSANAALTRLLECLGRENRQNLATEKLCVPEAHTRQWIAAYAQARNSGSPARFELRCDAADGPVSLGMMVNPIIDEPEGRPRFCVVVEDITARKRAEQALRESEEQVRLLLESTGEAILGVDNSSKCTFCNTACVRLLGYAEAGDLLGRDMHALVHHTRADGTPNPREECSICRACQGDATHSDNEVLWRADGTSFPVEYRSYPLRRGARDVGAVVTFTSTSERRRVEQELRDYATRLHALSRRVVEVQEEERRHLARELHDEIGQALTAIGIGFQTMKRSCSAATQLILDDYIGIVDRTIQQVRRLSLDLRPSMLDDLGLVAALRWYVDRQAQRIGYQANFSAERAEIRLNAVAATAAFRVAQEAMTNIARHANATAVWVTLRLRAGRLYLTVRDNGVGFDPASAHQYGSLGMLGMRERAELLGGRIAVRSAPGRGTVVRLKLPFGDGEEDDRSGPDSRPYCG